MTALISLMPETTAEKARNRARVRAAMIRASVVLPLPGGPQKTSDGTRSSAMARARNDPGPTRSGGPTTSGRSRGRIRSARGASGAGAAGALPPSSSSKRSPVMRPCAVLPAGAPLLERLLQLVERRELLAARLQLCEQLFRLRRLPLVDPEDDDLVERRLPVAGRDFQRAVEHRKS